MSNSKLFERARAFADAYPTRPPSRSSGTWDQLCGVLMYQFGGFLGGATHAQIRSDAGVKWAKRPTGSIASAIIVARGSGTLNKTASRAPIGAFHYWDIGRYGHVGIDLNGGGSDIFMATTHVRWGWGSAIGVQSAAGYSNATGAKYLGWATNYTGGIPKLPSEVGPRDRVVSAKDGVNARTAPSTRAQIVVSENRPNGAAIEMNAYADDGETVSGKSRWFRGVNGRWYWSGAFTSTAATSLTRVVTKPAPAPEPEPVNDPEPEQPADEQEAPVTPTPDPVDDIVSQPIPDEPEGAPEPDPQHAARREAFIRRIFTAIADVIRGRRTVGELAIATLRTVVPFVYSWVIVWATTNVSWLDWLAYVPADIALEVQSAAVIALGTGIYALLRKLAQRWPNLERLLGSAKTPTYTA